VFPGRPWNHGLASDCGVGPLSSSSIHPSLSLSVSTPHPYQSVRTGSGTAAGVKSASAQKSSLPSKILLCEYCNSSFASSSGLERHKKLVHLNKLPYFCSVCGQGFTEKDHFEGHMNRHNNFKAHKCPHCSHEFTYKTSLRRHIRHRHM